MTDRHLAALRWILKEWEFEAFENGVLFWRPHNDLREKLDPGNQEDADYLCGEVLRALLNMEDVVCVETRLRANGDQGVNLYLVGDEEILGYEPDEITALCEAVALLKERTEENAPEEANG